MVTFQYTQGNPGALIIGEYSEVFIDAPHYEVANELVAGNFGVYFDEYSRLSDCQCCAYRWDEKDTDSRSKKDFVIEDFVEDRFGYMKYKLESLYPIVTEETLRRDLFWGLKCVWLKHDGTIIEFDGFGEIFSA